MRETIYDMWRHCIKKASLCKFFLSKNKKTIGEDIKYPVGRVKIPYLSKKYLLSGSTFSLSRYED